MTASDYAQSKGIDIKEAKKQLEQMVKAGSKRKVVYDEMVYRKVRGYSEKLMPVKVAHYYDVLKGE